MAHKISIVIVLVAISRCLGQDVTDYASWRNSVFTEGQRADSEIGGATADPDHDGIVNFMEYSMGSNPWLANTSLTPVPDGYRFTRRTQISDIGLFAERSTDLQAWDLLPRAEWQEQTQADGLGWERVTIERRTVPPQKEFLRLRSTRTLWLRTCHGSGGWNFLYAGVSLDGTSFSGVEKRLLYGSWPNPGAQVRDPSVIFYQGNFVVAYTGDNFGQVPWFGMAQSSNLVDWSQLSNVVPSGFSGTVNNIWAPEWLVDEGRYFLVLRISTSQNDFYGPPGLG